MPVKPGEWANRVLSESWFRTCEEALTESRLEALCKLRGFANGERLLNSLAGLGFDEETESWVLPLWNVYTDRLAAKLWRPGGGKWITAGWAATRAPERNGEPIGRLFDLGWFLDSSAASLPWEKRWLWVTAGEWDCLMLRSVGWAATCSVNGETSHPQPEMLLREFGGEANALALLRNLRGIVVCFDVDDAGKQGAVQFVDAFDRMINDLVIWDGENGGGGLGDGWSGVKAIDLRGVSGWVESGEPEGWDVSDLLRWSRVSGVKVGGQLLGAAERSGIGVDAARDLLGVDAEITSQIGLGSVLVGGIHLIGIDDLLDLSLMYARNHGSSRAQGSFHFGRLAARKGWSLAELLEAGCIGRLISMWDRELPKGDDKLSEAFVYGQVSRSFFEIAKVEDLNTDLANAHRLAHYFPFLVFHRLLGWRFWDGVRWLDGTTQVWDHAARISDYVAEEAIAARDNGNNGLAGVLFKWSKQSRGLPRISSIVTLCGKLGLCQLDESIGEKWDGNGMMLGTPMGVFDLEVGRLLTGLEARNQFCSLNTRGSILLGDEGVRKWGDNWNFCWDFWTGLMAEWHPGKEGAETVRMLGEFAGLCLRGRLDETLVVLQGSGRSGKSAFMDALSRALGEYAYEISGDIMVRGGLTRGGAGSNAKTAAIAQLDQKRLVKVTEVGGRQLDIDLLKTLTGEIEMVGRALYSGWSGVRNVGTYWMMTNHELDLRGDVSEALRGRLSIVPWNVTFVHSSRLGADEYRSGVDDGSVRLMRGDVKFQVIGDAGVDAGKFLAMGDVVLSWAYLGLMRVLGRPEADVIISRRVLEFTAQLWENADPLGEYFETSGLWLAGGSSLVATDGLFRSWRSWAVLNDAESAEQIGDSKQRFSGLLQGLGARGYEKMPRKGSNKAIWANGKPQVNAWKVPWTWIGPEGGSNVV